MDRWCRAARPLLETSLASLLVIVLAPTAARAQNPSGANLTPDRQSYLVNKDIGEERWAIGLNLAATDPKVLLNVTGNVFFPGGGPPKFVICQPRPDSTGSLDRPESVFRFRCQGTDACPGTAVECSQSGWALLSEDIQLPASFFLPRGGGTPSSLEGVGSALPGPAARRGDLSTVAQEGGPRGATLTVDGNSYLVSKDIGAERWSISVNLFPRPLGTDGFFSVVSSITGNVFFPDGSPPRFVTCKPSEGSATRLDDSAGNFVLECFGSDACDLQAEDCADQTWEALGRFELPTSFFLPPGGLGRPSSANPEIIWLGTPGGPRSIVVKEFTQAAAQTTGAGGCPTGAACVVSRLGACTALEGAVTEVLGFGCGCRLDDVESDCFLCGSAATGSCGNACEFPLGSSSTVRGVCLPYAAGSVECACIVQSPDDGDDGISLGCGGPLAVGCPEGSCCADDPLDGCSLAEGNPTCDGLCVSADCSGGEASCGICDIGAARCGDGRAEGSEACDAEDLRGLDCRTLGFSGGDLRCAPDCELVDAGCIGCVSSGGVCSSDGDCCDGRCRGGRCVADIGPPTPTPVRTPPPRTATPRPSDGPAVCQPSIGGPCGGDGFQGCCSPSQSCVFGPGSPARLICAPRVVCGDGIRSGNEVCDDGNQVDGDACTNACQPARCGDGIPAPSVGEVCDDGNNVSGDGCSAACDALCGNSAVEPGELCDDGNTTSGDGCGGACNAICGNEIVEADEFCDDGPYYGYGCSAGCDAYCGNGTIEGGEECEQSTDCPGYPSLPVYCDYYSCQCLGD